MEVGDKVKIKKPFNSTYNGVYEVILVKDDEDITCTVVIDGNEIDFASKFLKKVEV